MRQLNCWEYKKCGREPGGSKADELGVCPAATETRLNNINYGKNGGRACWGVPGTLCCGDFQNNNVLRLAACAKCDFYQLVSDQEDWNYHDTKAIMKKLATCSPCLQS